MNIRLFYSGLTGTIYAVYAVRQRLKKAHADGMASFENTGPKQDVTQDAIITVLSHAAKCNRDRCPCTGIRYGAARALETLVAVSLNGEEAAPFQSTPTP